MEALYAHKYCGHSHLKRYSFFFYYCCLCCCGQQQQHIHMCVASCAETVSPHRPFGRGFPQQQQKSSHHIVVGLYPNIHTPTAAAAAEASDHNLCMHNAFHSTASSPRRFWRISYIICMPVGSNALLKYKIKMELGIAVGYDQLMCVCYVPGSYLVGITYIYFAHENSLISVRFHASACSLELR